MAGFDKSRARTETNIDLRKVNANPRRAQRYKRAVAPSGEVDSEAETVTQFDGKTIPQLEAEAGELRERVKLGQLSEGNVELAALLGSHVAQLALGRQLGSGMSVKDLVEFLLSDPNLHVQIQVRERGSRGLKV